ncbi:MAG TPA: hypothetical protein VGH19_08010 [Verrucomicrobiae bacterium]
MSFSFDLDTSRRTAYFTGQGCCDYVDFCVALNGLLNHPLYQAGMTIVWDWQRCEILLANTQICSLVETMTRNAGADQTHRVAIITSIPTHSSAVTFQKYIEAMSSSYRAMLFTSLEQASHWINASSGSSFNEASFAGMSQPPGATAFFKVKAPAPRHGNSMQWKSL